MPIDHRISDTPEGNMEDYGNGHRPAWTRPPQGRSSPAYAATMLPCRRATRRCCGAWPSGWRRSPPRSGWPKSGGFGQAQPAGKDRPLVFCDPENGWNEIITEAQMQCRGKLARRWEMDLRKEIFWGEVMGDDKPVEPYFDVPYTVSPDDWGLQAAYHKHATAGLVCLGRRDQGLRHRPEEAARAAVRDRLGNDQRLPGHRPARCWAIC